MFEAVRLRELFPLEYRAPYACVRLTIHKRHQLATFVLVIHISLVYAQVCTTPNLARTRKMDVLLLILAPPVNIIICFHYLLFIITRIDRITQLLRLNYFVYAANCLPIFLSFKW